MAAPCCWVLLRNTPEDMLGTIDVGVFDLLLVLSSTLNVVLGHYFSVILIAGPENLVLVQWEMIAKPIRS